MRDTLEDQLADRLKSIGRTVADDIPTPVDLDARVRHRRNRSRAVRRWTAISVAAGIVAVVAGAALVQRTNGPGSVRIATSPTTGVALHDSLQPGTVLLSARGPYVISLGVDGHTNATMVTTKHGNIVYARATDDHRELWYLSQKHGQSACGDVVRADVDSNSSAIVTHAVSFDVSPDGSRLALYGAGDLAAGRCEPATRGAPTELTVVDLASATSSTLPIADITSMRWATGGDYLVLTSCSRQACGALRRVDVPRDLTRPLVDTGVWSSAPGFPTHVSRVEFGQGGLYALDVRTTHTAKGAAVPDSTVIRLDVATPGSTVEQLYSGGGRWDVSQIMPTSSGTFAVAAPVSTGGTLGRTDGPTGLYRIVAGQLVLVRNLAHPGIFTPVTPLFSGG